MNLRPFKPADTQALANVYQNSVRTIGPRLYSQQQIDAWAGSVEDIEGLRTRLSRGITLVAEIEGKPIAFGQFSPPDHLSLLYCTGEYCRRGVGSAIYDELERRALAIGAAEIRLEASEFGRSFFEKKGFRTIEIENALFNGAEFERFRMVKKLPNKSPEPTPTAVTPRATEANPK